MAEIGLFVAGFVAFPICVIAVGGVWAWRALRKDMQW